MGKDITNEQLFEFMTKMYGEMQEIKENMATKDGLAKTNQSIVRLENKMDTNHKALYDGYNVPAKVPGTARLLSEYEHCFPEYSHETDEYYITYRLPLKKC
ncbi:MAG: hypothetical protein GX968_07585 [Tissierellia bacterium]|nr:hypothetical protein [Tissierellia bacterium]